MNSATSPRRAASGRPQVILSPIGGIAAMERMPERPRQELLVAIAGPLVNVAIALLLVILFGLGPRLAASIDFDYAALAECLLIVNVMLVLFNLIPAFPMDCGRVLHATALAARLAMAMPWSRRPSCSRTRSRSPRRSMRYCSRRRRSLPCRTGGSIAGDDRRRRTKRRTRLSTERTSTRQHRWECRSRSARV